MKPLALAFSGRIASGKTALSSEVANRLGWPRVGFGNYVRTVAAERGLSTEGEVLQILGESLIREKGWECFCLDVLAQEADWRSGMPIVLDGVRHVEVVDVLRRLVAPSPLRLVLIRTDEAVRAERLARRARVAPKEASRKDDHSTEVQLVGQLAAIADLVVDGGLPVERATGVVLAWLAAQLAGHP